jgi:O-antigen/teichoic acid export membrane protein
VSAISRWSLAWATTGPLHPYEILGRVRRHLVGRVATLAAATAFSAILSVALLPYVTQHLGASDYGTYGLLVSIVALVTAAADGGASLLVPAHYALATASQRARLFVSLAVFAGAAASAAGLLLIILWGWQHGTFSNQAIPLTAILLSAVLMPIRAITNITVLIFSVTGCGPALAAQLAIQSLVAFLSTLVALFGLRMGGASLFVGAICGQFAALGVGLVALGRQHVLSAPSRDWLRRAAISAPTTAASGLVDGTRGFGENVLLTTTLGLHAVGILGHARLYHGLLMAFGNSVRYNLWSKSLEEARSPDSSFEITRSAWTPVQIIIACAGIIFAFRAQEIVNIISNGQFAEAAAYIPALFVFALIQTTEQPANAIVSASSQARSATWIRTIMALASFIVLCPAVVLFGIKGVIAVCIIEAIAYRVYLRVLASRERKLPFQDHVAVFGSCAIIAETAYVHWAVPPLTIQLALMALGIATLTIIGRRSISEMVSAARQIVLGATSDRYGWGTSGALHAGRGH